MHFLLPFLICMIIPGIFYWFFSGSFLYGLLIIFGGYFLSRLVFKELFNSKDWHNFTKSQNSDDNPLIKRGGIIFFTQILLIIAISTLRSKGYLN
jgi:hypothetical protein